MRHGCIFRIPVTSKDEKKTTVTFQIDGHRKWAMPYVLGDIAKNLRLDKDEVLTVFADWTPEQLVAHLQAFTADELRPPSFRR